MLSVFESVANFFRVKRLCVDNNVFRLHYKFTAGSLILCAIVVSAYQFFGDPIKCLKTSTRQEVVETFCWAHATFSIPDSFDKEYGEEVPYPGVDKYVKGKTKTVYHQYYQWVFFVLLFQAILFVTPHYIWKAYENGRIKDSVLDLDLPILEYETKEKNRMLLVQCLKDRLKLNKNYFIVYALCEVLNFVNVVGQIFLIDKFLGYSFTTYGTKILQYTEMDIRERPDVMTRVFPKMTKCLFYLFGPSASLEKVDTLCVLPLNVINEKIYAFMWFWFVILATVTGVLLLYRKLIVVSGLTRYYMLLFRCTLVDRSDLQTIVDHCDIGDWFVLELLSKNIDGCNFRDVISDLAKEIRDQGTMT